MTAASPDRERLATRLRQLREATGLSGNRFATERIGWTQSRLSRIELGVQVPSEADIEAWVEAVEATPDVAAELRDLLRHAEEEYEANRDVRKAGGAGADQVRLGRRYARAKRIRHHQPSMIPGVLQTAEYARELLFLPCGPAAFGATARDIEEKVAARVGQQAALYRPGKRLQYVIGEAALRNPPRTVAALVGQLDRLATLTGLAGIEVGITPLGAPMPVIPLSGFIIFDEDFVTVETLDGERRMSNEETVALYVKAFDDLMASAAVGSDAVALIRRVMADLQG